MAEKERKKTKTNKNKKTKGAKTNKNSSAKKRSTGKSAEYYRKKDLERDSWINDEITVILSFAISIFLLLSLFGLCGPIGRALKGFQLGLFGTTGYLFPFVLSFMVIFILSNQNNSYANSKLTAGLFMLLFISSFIQLVFGSDMENMGLTELFTSAADGAIGGGIAGGSLAMLLFRFAGKTGASIIIFFAILICLVFITEKPLMRLMARKSKDVYVKAKDDIEELAEKKRIKREERECVIDFDAMDLKASREVSNLNQNKLKNFVFETGDVKDIINPKKDTEALDEDGGFLDDELSEEFIKNIENVKRNEERDNKKPSFVIKGLETDDLELDIDDTEIIDLSPKVHKVNDTKDIKVSKDTKDKDLKSIDPSTREIVTSTGKVIKSDITEVHERMERLKNEASIEDKEEVKKEAKKAEETKPYVFPPLSLLKSGSKNNTESRESIEQNALILQDTLKSFGVGVEVTNVSVGPAVTRYELKPEKGVKVSKIVALTDDIKMRLAAEDIRIEAPIPGKAAVGIEVPNKESQMVYLGDILKDDKFLNSKAKLSFGLGKDISGQVVVSDIEKMPHMLIAGATGSGKSVCINTLIMSMIYKYDPKDVRLIMVDPKVVELQIYNGIPHLLIPVVTDPKKASAALSWAVNEMTDRYKKFAELGVRDLKSYNEKINEINSGLSDIDPDELEECRVLPRIVIIIDELADLMMVSATEVEESICRLAQLARAAGMHLVIATQRPSVNVITGLIKANVPSRIAFAVSSGVDSRTIIDMNGAEKLMGKGDMLYFPQDIPKPLRCQGAFVSDDEVRSVVDFVKKNTESNYHEEIKSVIERPSLMPDNPANERDELFKDAGICIIESDKASIGMLQRRFRIGFNRAARIMDQLSDAGVVGPENGTKPRDILMTMEEFEEG